jgi:hypothetical protein
VAAVDTDVVAAVVEVAAVAAAEVAEDTSSF